MTKEVKKSSGKMSLFKRISLGEMICGWTFLVIVGVALGLIDTNDDVAFVGGLVAGVAALVAFGMAIAQMITLKKYGDIFGKLTKKSATIIFAVFTALAWIGIILAGIFLFLFARLPHGEEAADLRQLYAMIIACGAFVTLLSSLGYTITSTIAFAKAK